MSAHVPPYCRRYACYSANCAFVSFEPTNTRGNEWILALINKIISVQVPSYIGTVPNSGTGSVLSLLPTKRLDLYIDFRWAKIDVCRTMVRKENETRNAIRSTASPCAYQADCWNARDAFLSTKTPRRQNAVRQTDRQRDNCVPFAHRDLHIFHLTL